MKGDIMDVSIIMINYNTYELTKAAIESIFTYTKELIYEIILIDNASPDGSGEKLKGLFADRIKYIGNSENLGTSKAFNQGLSIAEGKYILWLNTDILLFDNFVKKLYDFMEENADCGVCGGNLLNAEKKPSHSFRKKMISVKTLKQDKCITRWALRKAFKKIISDGYNYSKKAKEVGYITGADMFVRKAVFDEIGGLDEDIFMYCEETEFQFRVKNRTKYKIMSVPWAKMIHLEGRSFEGNFNVRRHRYSTIGTAIFIRKSYGEKQTIDYFESLKKNYKKYVIICSFLQLKNKKEMYMSKLKNVKDIQSKFPTVKYF